MKKAQTAFEFLATFGFALLVVLIAVSAISMAVLFSNKKVPEFCSFTMSMPCIGRPSLSSTGMRMALKNNVLGKIKITDIFLSDCSGIHSISAGKYNQSYTPVPVVIDRNQIFKISSDCSLYVSYEGQMIITYKNIETGLENSVTGQISGNVV